MLKQRLVSGLYCLQIHRERKEIDRFRKDTGRRRRSEEEVFETLSMLFVFPVYNSRVLKEIILLLGTLRSLLGTYSNTLFVNYSV